MNENYAMINGKKFELNEEIVKIIKKNEINHKEYKIGHLEIIPNWAEGGYLMEYYSDVENDGAVYLGNIGYPKNIVITQKELPEIIEALTEINNFLQEQKQEDE